MHVSQFSCLVLKWLILSVLRSLCTACAAIGYCLLSNIMSVSHFILTRLRLRVACGKDKWLLQN